MRYHQDAAVAYLIDCNRRLIRALEAPSDDWRAAHLEEAKEKLANADKHLMKISRDQAPPLPPDDSNGIIGKGL